MQSWYEIEYKFSFSTNNFDCFFDVGKCSRICVLINQSYISMQCIISLTQKLCLEYYVVCLFCKLKFIDANAKVIVFVKPKLSTNHC